MCREKNSNSRNFNYQLLQIWTNRHEGNIYLLSKNGKKVLTIAYMSEDTIARKIMFNNTRLIVAKQTMTKSQGRSLNWSHEILFNQVALPVVKLWNMGHLQCVGWGLNCCIYYLHLCFFENNDFKGVLHTFIMIFTKPSKDSQHNIASIRWKIH